jgi:osmotically-inducible protein OsmY
MKMEERNLHRSTKLMAIGLLALGLTACGPKPATEGQASKDTGRMADQSPSPAAPSAAPAAGAPGTPGPQAANEADNTSPARTQSVDDLALNVKVEDALKENPTLKSLPITVKTVQGVVTLTGNADTTANRDQATQVVMNVTGVKAVDNKLAVSSAG